MIPLGTLGSPYGIVMSASSSSISCHSSSDSASWEDGDLDEDSDVDVNSEAVDELILGSVPNIVPAFSEYV